MASPCCSRFRQQQPALASQRESACRRARRHGVGKQALGRAGFLRGAGGIAARRSRAGHSGNNPRRLPLAIAGSPGRRARGECTRSATLRCASSNLPCAVAPAPAIPAHDPVCLHVALSARPLRLRVVPPVVPRTRLRFASARRWCQAPRKDAALAAGRSVVPSRWGAWPTTYGTRQLGTQRLSASLLRPRPGAHGEVVVAVGDFTMPIEIARSIAPA